MPWEGQWRKDKKTGFRRTNGKEDSKLHPTSWLQGDQPRDYA